MLHEAYNLMYYFPDGVPQGADLHPAEIPLCEVLDNPNISSKWKSFLLRIKGQFGDRIEEVPFEAVEIMMSEIPPDAREKLKAAKARVFRLVTDHMGSPPTHCSAYALGPHVAHYEGRPRNS